LILALDAPLDDADLTRPLRTSVCVSLAPPAGSGFDDIVTVQKEQVKMQQQQLQMQQQQLQMQREQLELLKRVLMIQENPSSGK